MAFEDIIYEIRNGVAWITINRPEKMNAFRGQTCDELINALYQAGYDKNVGAIVLAGAGDRAFCTGGKSTQIRKVFEFERQLVQSSLGGAQK